MNTTPYRYVFGPVMSRRLGRSLGIDLTPHKTCSYDCIYCQLGPTTRHTVERRAYVPLEAVYDEIARKLETGRRPDYITLAGSGEPTLHSGLGEFLREAKRRWDIPLAVITNGSLFWDPQVRADVAAADVVIPSLDAGAAETFSAVNRPEHALAFEEMVDGLVQLRNEYAGLIWLEIMLVAGMNDTDEEVARFREQVARVRPDRIHLNTVVRPSRTAPAPVVSSERLQAIAQLLGPTAEVIAGASPVGSGNVETATEGDVLALVQRHPCSVDDIAAGLSVPVSAVLHVLDTLLDQELLVTEILDGVVMYEAAQASRVE